MLLAHARGRPRLHDRRQHARDRAHQPHGLASHGLPGAAEQGDRRPQRLRARVGHPPGRRAQGPLDLRDHGRDDDRAGGQRPRAGQALGPARAASQRAAGAGLPGRGPGAEHGVQALQGAGRPQEAGHGDGPGGARHRRAPRGAALLHARVVRRRRVQPPAAARARRGPLARRRGARGRLHRRRPGRRDLPRHQRGHQARGPAPRVPDRRGHGRPGRARRGERGARARGPVGQRARASRPTSSRRRRRPTCARSPTRSARCWRRPRPRSPRSSSRRRPRAG